MVLTKSQTYKILNEIRKRQVFQNKYNFTTKFEIRCLNCMKVTYIRHNVYGRKNCFCSECYSKFQDKPTIAQFKYIQVQKEKQLKFLEKSLEKTLEKSCSPD